MHAFIIPLLTLLSYIHTSFRRTFATLNVIWHMRDRLHESITLGKLLADIVREFEGDVSLLSKSERKQKSEVRIYACIHTYIHAYIHYTMLIS